jgi:hypothetical protein
MEVEPKNSDAYTKVGKRNLCCHYGGMAVLLEENSGEVVAAYLLPHHLSIYVILYMNIIEFIHVAIKIPLPA